MRLLLGLAFLLATSSSLLVSYGSGRGDNGRFSKEDSQPFPEPGEIAGSVSISSSGEIWLTAFVDQYAVLSQIEVVEDDDGVPKYKISVAGIGHISVQNEAESIPDFKPEDAVFYCAKVEDAVEQLILLVDRIGLGLSKLTLQSIPVAVRCGWKPPIECSSFIQHLLKEHRLG